MSDTFLLFINHPVYGILLEQSVWTKTGSITGAFVQRGRAERDEGILSHTQFSRASLPPSSREDTEAHRDCSPLRITELVNERAASESRHSDLTHMHAVVSTPRCLGLIPISKRLLSGPSGSPLGHPSPLPRSTPPLYLLVHHLMAPRPTS